MTRGEETRSEKRQEEPRSRVVIGEVRRPHGIRGEIKVHPLTEHRERFFRLQAVYINGAKRRVTQARLAHDGVILRLEGVGDRTQAEALRGSLLEVDLAEVFPLPEGEYYWFQLQGLRAVTDTGKELGRVTEIWRTPAHDVLVIAGSSEAGGQRPQYLVPAVRAVVAEVDLDRGRLVVREIPGLLG